MRIVRALAFVYLALGLLATLLVPASLHGWFGMASDPLSAVVMYLLALPWILLLTFAPDGSTHLAVAVGLIGVLINFGLLMWLAQRLRREKT